MSLEQAITSRTVVVVAAHPDDETVSAGCLLRRLRHPVLVHVTDGAPRALGDTLAAGFERREDYAEARQRELFAALEHAGIPREQLRMLNVVDQEASLEMAYLALRLVDILCEIRPGVVLTHPYEGGHPDHDAAAFTVHAACARIPAPPDIYEFTSYHAVDGERPAIETSRFLSGTDAGERIVLSEAEREWKRRMVECFTTQLHMLRHFPLDVEAFRAAPSYDFTQAPHAGKLFYEHFNWGVTGERWRLLAGEALHTLGLSSTL